MKDKVHAHLTGVYTTTGEDKHEFEGIQGIDVVRRKKSHHPHRLWKRSLRSLALNFMLMI